MTDYAITLAAASQALQQANIYTRGVDTFLRNIELRLKASEAERVLEQTKLDTDIEHTVQGMHQTAQDYFTQWEQVR
jgi:hypothetical protein